MTPLEFAEALAVDLSTFAALLPMPIPAGPLPAPFHAQLGDIVVDCPGTTVTIQTVTDVDPTGGGGNRSHCDTIEMANVIIIAARDCSFVANEDGTTDWDKQDLVSTQQDNDANALREHAEKWRADAWYLPIGVPVTLTFTNTGNLAWVQITLQLPIP